MLVLATAGWGFGFTWAKTAQEEVNHRLGLSGDAAVGPLLTVSLRYVAAGLLILCVVRRARKGWSHRSVHRALGLGGLLGAALVLQHLGLGRTSAAVSAFLTSLSFVFVPVILSVFFKRHLSPWFWVAVALASVGVWLVTGMTPSGFGLGELLGVASAAAFSFYLLALSAVVPRDDPWRMSAGQLLVSGLLVGSLLLANGLSTSRLQEVLGDRLVMWNTALSLTFSTFMPLTIVNLYQPKVDRSKIGLIYLLEPIFASIYAFFIYGLVPSYSWFVGAMLIVTANAVSEVLDRFSRDPATDVSA